MKGHVEIAGAGFAGLTAAIALSQRGWTVRVHEVAPELRAFGAGIYIWENGLRVLAAIGAYDDVVAGAHEAGVYETRHDNRVVGAQQFGMAACGTRMLTMTRQHLYAAIVAAAARAGVEVVTSSEVVGAVPDGVLLTADGGRHRADLVIGADGVKSKVRDRLALLRERQVYDDGIVRVLGPRLKQELGPGTWDHVIDFWSFEPRLLRVLYTPCDEQDLYLAMMAPVNDRDASVIPINADIWMKSFPQLTPVIRSIGARGRYDPYETTKATRWSAGRVAIVGDSAHAMAPTLGQGAGTAMMNALALAVAAERAVSVEAALDAWERAERPLTEHTQDTSAAVAKGRRFSGHGVWNDETLRTARHIPTGTERLNLAT
ncbi:MAG: FAD-dependent monooxygenase [Alphaproteobacteria bacterium]|nr:FAD-dependent monooxygenase [Alphaproteobacteria bacterium]